MSLPALFRCVPALALAAGLAAGPVHAQAFRGVTPGPVPPGPSFQARSALAAPNPAGLRPRFPAGLTAGSGVIDSGIANPGRSVPDFLPPPPWVVVAGSGWGARGPAQSVPGGSAGYNPVDVARWFMAADRNHDGELSRAEAQRLPWLPLSFEEMDRNFDGVLSRWEFEDGLR